MKPGLNLRNLAATGFAAVAALTAPAYAQSPFQPEVNAPIDANTLLSVDGLTPAQTGKIVAQFQAVIDEIKPDIVLFGENHCKTQSKPLLRMFNQRGNYGAVFFEESPGKQSSIDSIMTYSVRPDLSPAQKDLLRHFEADIIRSMSEDGKSGCNVKQIRDAGAAAEVALAIDLAAQGRKFIFDDENIENTDELQAKLHVSEDPALRRQFDLLRHNEKKLAAAMSLASQKAPVWALGGIKHYIEEIPGNDTSVRQNLPGRTVLTVAFEYEPGEISKWQKLIEDHGNRFVSPDLVVRLYGPSPAVVVYEDGKQSMSGRGLH